MNIILNFITVTAWLSLAYSLVQVSRVAYAFANPTDNIAAYKEVAEREGINIFYMVTKYYWALMGICTVWLISYYMGVWV